MAVDAGTPPADLANGNELFRVSGLLRFLLALGFLGILLVMLAWFLAIPQYPVSAALHLTIYTPACIYFGTGLGTVSISDHGISYRFGWLRPRIAYSEMNRVWFDGLVFQMALLGNGRILPIHPLLDNYADLFRLVRAGAAAFDLVGRRAFPLRVGPSLRLRIGFAALWLGAVATLLSQDRIYWVPGAVFFALLIWLMYLPLRPRFYFDADGVTKQGILRKRRYMYADLTELELIQNNGLITLYLDFGAEKLRLKGVFCSVPPERIYSLLASHLMRP